MEEKIFKGLNTQQAEAVRSTEGMVRVVAGAGSGKTRVLANRYAYLTECVGIDPANILCMTFTNKAAQEMRNRIRKMTDSDTANDYICTIHGLCVKILRREIHRLGYPKNFIILDNEDSKTLMKQVMEEHLLTHEDVTVAQLLANTAMMKSTTDYIPLLLPDAVWPETTDNPQFLRFLQLQRKSFALDFNDLIFFTLYILGKYADARDHWQREFDYIQVDEVQDCSNTDWELIDILSEKSENLFIVGDPDQAIYEWRGAKPDRFVNFKAHKDVILDENYRSTPNILDVANSVIRNNRNRIEKDLRTSVPSDTIAIHRHAKSEEEEGQWIATLIDTMIKDGCKPDEFAILYRASSQSRFIEQALMKSKVPYTIWGGIRFFERKEIKDCLAYLRLLENKDDISFKRIVNVPSRKFGKVRMEKLAGYAEKEDGNLFNTLRRHLGEAPFDTKPIKEFVYMTEAISLLRNQEPVSELLDKILTDTGLLDLYRNDGDEDRVANINELMNSIRHYEDCNANDEITLEKYLQDISLFANNEIGKDTPTVKLMTIHQSKGLEFPYVFVIGLTEGIFPSHRTIRERKLSGLEEERRLMYVAITRAEKALFLTASEGYNYTTRTDKFPSRFISEIGEGLVKVDGFIDPVLITRRNVEISNLDNEIGIIADTSAFSEGDKVKHGIFGNGIVLSVNNERKSAEVDFGGRTRNILWKFIEKAE